MLWDAVTPRATGASLSQAYTTLILRQFARVHGAAPLAHTR